MNPISRSIDELMRLPYSIQIAQEETTDGGICFTASHPELPGCMAHGDTKAEALTNLTEARRLYLQALVKRGLPLPRPTSGTSTIVTWEPPNVVSPKPLASPTTQASSSNPVGDRTLTSAA